jgi:hypothetical protein
MIHRRLRLLTEHGDQTDQFTLVMFGASSAATAPPDAAVARLLWA